MNNKRGGVGAKILLVLILMIASAVAGAYGFRVLDGKMAAKDAIRTIEDVDVDDYDTTDSTTISDYIEESTTKINAAKSRKEVYEILDDFRKDVSRVKTKSEKDAEALLEKAQQSQKTTQNNATEDNETGYGVDENEGTSNGLKLFNSDDGSNKSNDNSGGLFGFGN